MNLDGINEKKTIANGLMDFAFLTANANQLHNAVNSSNKSGERTTSIVLISISIFIQVMTRTNTPRILNSLLNFFKISY
jgi:hypothetical protein